MVLNEYELMKTEISCDLVMCGYPVGRTSRCDDSKLFASTVGFYDDYASIRGTAESITVL